jgi:putative DNA primase/helicase
MNNTVNIPQGTDLNNAKVTTPHNRKKHDEIFTALLEEIHPINFKDYLGLPEKEPVAQKHIVVAVIKFLLQISKEKNWNLSKVFDYTYIFNGEYWQQCDKDIIKDFLGKVAIKMGCPDYEARHYEFKDKLLKQFISDAHLPPPPTDVNRISINLQNGTFEFTANGWALRGFNADDFITYQLPFHHTPDATCPMFDKYLSHVLPDPESRILLQEFSGYIFTPLHFEKMLVLYGSGRNGKSVFFNILQALIGIENILTYSLGLFNHEYNRAKLTNVLLNYSSEKGADLNTETFKALISGEPQQAREPYGKSFTLRNKVRFIMNANELPKETEQTSAFFERWLIIPFDKYIEPEERDERLAKNIIAQELPGVFNWLLGGLNRIMTQAKFSDCKKADVALNEFKRQSDNVALFVEEFNYITSSASKDALADLYSEYKVFCHDDGYKPCGKNKFSQRLERMGFEKYRNNIGTFFRIEKKNVF